MPLFRGNRKFETGMKNRMSKEKKKDFLSILRAEDTSFSDFPTLSKTGISLNKRE